MSRERVVTVGRVSPGVYARDGRAVGVSPQGREAIAEQVGAMLREHGELAELVLALVHREDVREVELRLTEWRGYQYVYTHECPRGHETRAFAEAAPSCPWCAAQRASEAEALLAEFERMLVRERRAELALVVDALKRKAQQHMRRWGR